MQRTQLATVSRPHVLLILDHALVPVDSQLAVRASAEDIDRREWIARGLSILRESFVARIGKSPIVGKTRERARQFGEELRAILDEDATHSDEQLLIALISCMHAILKVLARPDFEFHPQTDIAESSGHDFEYYAERAITSCFNALRQYGGPVDDVRLRIQQAFSVYQRRVRSLRRDSRVDAAQIKIAAIDSIEVYIHQLIQEFDGVPATVKALHFSGLVDGMDSIDGLRNVITIYVGDVACRCRKESVVNLKQNACNSLFNDFIASLGDRAASMSVGTVIHEFINYLSRRLPQFVDEECVRRFAEVGNWCLFPRLHDSDRKNHRPFRAAFVGAQLRPHL